MLAFSFLFFFFVQRINYNNGILYFIPNLPVARKLIWRSVEELVGENNMGLALERTKIDTCAEQRTRLPPIPGVKKKKGARPPFPEIPSPNQVKNSIEVHVVHVVHKSKSSKKK